MMESHQKETLRIMILRNRGEATEAGSMANRSLIFIRVILIDKEEIAIGTRYMKLHPLVLLNRKKERVSKTYKDISQLMNNTQIDSHVAAQLIKIRQL